MPDIVTAYVENLGFYKVVVQVYRFLAVIYISFQLDQYGLLGRMLQFFIFFFYIFLFQSFVIA